MDSQQWPDPEWIDVQDAMRPMYLSWPAMISKDPMEHLTHQRGQGVFFEMEDFSFLFVVFFFFSHSAFFNLNLT